VVEEMAIASGIPVPKTYVLDNEHGINAFAAGHTVNDAAVAVTRGTLERLNRSELQGVIGHEFSHVMNGDMRLNIKLIGIIFGILALGILGRILIRVGGSGGRSRKGGANVIPLAGLMLLLIGYIGTFVGRMIQAAVSRQREFLADSSAVQYTRDPSGLAGALKKIGGIPQRSWVQSPKAEQASHLFFSPGVRLHFFASALATHPPLDVRIRRLDPTFDGVFPPAEALAEEGEAGEAAAPGLAGRLAAETRVAADPAAVIDRVGNMDEVDPVLGRALLGLIPEPVKGAVLSREGAVSVVTALFLDRNEEGRRAQKAILEEKVSRSELGAIETAYAGVRGLDPRARLPLADLAAPALRDLDPIDRESFLARIDALVESDARVTLQEFALQRIVARRLRRAARPVDTIRYRSFGPLLRDVTALLGALGREGSGGDGASAEAAFRKGVERIPDLARTSLPFRADAATDLAELAQALDRLAEASFGVREKVIDASAHTVLADGVVTLEEAELLRAVSVSLDCPMPPFPPGVAPGGPRTV
jgi:Zn-dependent protease with chaperone function